MRKKILGMLAVCSLTASAQVTIKPQLSAGLLRTYHLKGYNTTVNQNATDSLTYSADQSFKVESVDADSAVVSMGYAHIQTSQGNALPDLELLTQHSLVFSVNRNGTPRHLLNAKELIDAYKVKDSDEDNDEYLNYLFSDDYLVSNLSTNSVLELFGKTIENGRTMQKVGDEEVEVSYRLSTDGHTVEAESEPDPQTVVKKHFVFGNDGWPVTYRLSTTINMGEDMGKTTLETDAVLTDAQ